MPRDLIRRLLTDGLGDARNPLGVLRWRLENALPDAPPPAPASPSAPPAAPAAAPRLRGMRECAGRHTQPRLFAPRPGHDDDRCPECRAERQAPPTAAPPTLAGPGYDEFTAARRAARERPASPGEALQGGRRDRDGSESTCSHPAVRRPRTCS
jgi:hypothetical protein